MAAITSAYKFIRGSIRRHWARCVGAPRSRRIFGSYASPEIARLPARNSKAIDFVLDPRRFESTLPTATLARPAARQPAD